MPQTSPMNWMIITTMFLILINTMMTMSKSMNKTMMTEKTFLFSKNISWMW